MKKFLAIFLASYLYGQWEQAVRITNYPNYYDYGSWNNAWTIAVNDSFVHIVWYRSRIGAEIGEIYYVRSTNYGTNFGAHQQLTIRDSYYPSISVNDSFVYIVWMDNRDGNTEIYYNRSKDYGKTWDINNFRLTDNTGESWHPSISSQDSFVYVVWMDTRDGDYEIYYNRSKDYGKTWDINNFRFTDNPGMALHPSISSQDSFVHIVWMDSRDGNPEIYYNRSKDYGKTWAEDFRITTNTDISWHSSISTQDSFVYIVWMDDRDGNYEIYYNRSKDYGRTWDINNFRLTDNPAESWHPSISSIDSFVHIAWRDMRDGNFEIYYKKSKDYGKNWSKDEKLTNMPGNAYFPSVTCSRSLYDVHLVWADDSDGNFEIYYKRHKQEIAVEENIAQNIEISSSSIGNIKFWLKLNTEGIVELKVFDIAGRLVDKINKNYSKGNYTITWRNNQGIYFFLFKINNDKKIIKGIIL